jgi:hypothetical protein
MLMLYDFLGPKVPTAPVQILMFSLTETPQG